MDANIQPIISVDTCRCQTLVCCHFLYRNNIDSRYNVVYSCICEDYLL